MHGLNSHSFPSFLHCSKQTRQNVSSPSVCLFLFLTCWPPFFGLNALLNFFAFHVFGAPPDFFRSMSPDSSFLLPSFRMRFFSMTCFWMRSYAHKINDACMTQVILQLGFLNFCKDSSYHYTTDNQQLYHDQPNWSLAVAVFRILSVVLFM